MLLENDQIRAALEAQGAPTYVDTDGLFDEARNCDYSHIFGGITRERFIEHFLPFIRVCVEQQEGMEVRGRRELSALTHSLSLGSIWPATESEYFCTSPVTQFPVTISF